MRRRRRRRKEGQRFSIREWVLGESDALRTSLSMRTSFMGLVGAVFWSAWYHNIKVNISIYNDIKYAALTMIVVCRRSCSPTFGCLLVAACNA